jgi:hypothetical protein
MLKVSTSYLEKQKSFNPKKNNFLALVNIKTKKLCLLTQFFGKVLIIFSFVHSAVVILKNSGEGYKNLLYFINEINMLK